MRTTTAVGLFYCSQDELAAVRRHLPSSMTVTLYADDGSDAACDFAVIGASAVKRRAVLIALREKLKGIKQKLSSVLVIAASTVVSGYDFFAPIVSGVDNQFADRSGATMGLALVLISLTALFQFLRNRMALLHVAGGGVGHLPGR